MPPSLSNSSHPELVADPTTYGSFAVRTKDFRDVKTFLDTTLADPNFAHFLASRQPAPPVNRPGAATPAAAPLFSEPSNLGEDIVRHVQQARAAAVARRRPQDGKRQDRHTGVVRLETDLSKPDIAARPPGLDFDLTPAARGGHSPPTGYILTC